MPASPAAKDNVEDFYARKELGEFFEKELSTLDILLTTKVSRTAVTLEEYIKVRLLQGADIAVIRADLLNDLETGGRIFGEFNRAVQATFKGSVNRFRDGAFSNLIGTDIRYRWVAVLINTCPDCLERHGKDRTWAEWEAEGLPRTGQTVCKENCKCVLMPAQVAELEPIQRGK